ncbi:uncharacterized protein LOC116348329 [Contarinia nasturtii]|uniref:uncharacterized protein LOC116348329 n=1 Tax=Contarinia nasturtii TaxID=265458 RepID=UPI0012D403F9|nr:uncharacterized protein LOC116348329 [Contarinia nasturtii]
MNTFSYLQPNLMTTEQLRDHLKIRFPNQNVSLLQRGELLKLFSMYAVPKARRGTSNGDIEMKPVTNTNVASRNEYKRPRHQLITPPTVETVTNACKKIRLINKNIEGVSPNNKRQCNPLPMESDQSQTYTPPESKRKKITWP